MGLNRALWNSRYWLAGLHLLFLAGMGTVFFSIILVAHSFELKQPGMLSEVWHTTLAHWYIPALCVAGLWAVAAMMALQPPLDIMEAEEADVLGRKDLQNRLEALCLARNLAVPRLYIINRPTMNAIIWGRNTYRIYVTKGACEKLSAEELDAVMAQMLGLLHNGETYVFPIMALFIVIGSQISLWPIAGLAFVLMQAGPAGFVFFVPVVIPVLLTVIIFGLLWLSFRSYGIWFSRIRRFNADLFAVQLSQNAAALAQAIEKAGNDAKLALLLPDESLPLAFLNPDPEAAPPWYQDPDERIEALRETLGSPMLKAR